MTLNKYVPELVPWHCYSCGSDETTGQLELEAHHTQGYSWT
jgi:hypothetical protein